MSTSAAGVSSHHHHHNNRDLALQKYLLLHEQHESLRQHLDGLRPLQMPSFGSATTASPATSPTRTDWMSSFSSPSPTSPSPPPYPYHSFRHHSASPTRHRSFPRASLETVPDETTLAEMADDEARLCDVNEGIKRALTELLNCEAVRSDRAFRTWVQSRLMDTEREMRSRRRRRSAPEP